MKIVLLLPGKIKPGALQDAETEYLKRLKRGLGAEVITYKDERVDNRPPEHIQEKEAGSILRHVNDSDALIACDERGKALSTDDMATWLNQVKQQQGKFAGKQRCVIVIGGALGLHERIRERATQRWALSSLVMAGGIARIVLLEALYRAHTIVTGHPYHNA